MNIFDIRKHLAGKTLTKDSTTLRGEDIVSFVSFPALTEWLRANLPAGVTYHVSIEFAPMYDIHVGVNMLVGRVYLEGEDGPKDIYTERMLVPLYDNPMDAAGAVTMLKKTVIMSMFDIVPNDASDDRQDLDATAMKGLLKVVVEEGLATALERGARSYNLTERAIKTLREKAQAIIDAEQEAQEAAEAKKEAEEAAKAPQTSPEEAPAKKPRSPKKTA